MRLGQRHFQKQRTSSWFRNIISKHYQMCNERELFFHYFRISPERFDHLLILVREQIEKKDAAFRKSSPGADWLAITLRYLESGEGQQSLSYSYHREKHCINRHCRNL